MTKADEPVVRGDANDGNLASGGFGSNRQGAEARQARQGRGWPEPARELDELAHQVIGAALEVHRHLGPGFLEQVYEKAVCIELGLRRVSFQRQVTLPVEYKGNVIAESRIDLLVEESLVLELKAVEDLRAIHWAQVMSSLRAGEFQLGLLINFNVSLLRDGIRRIVWTG
jgi:GxxExxY protein